MKNIGSVNSKSRRILKRSPDPNLENTIPIRSQGKPRFRDIISNIPLLIGGIIVLGLFLSVLFGPLFAPTNPYITGQHNAPHYDTEKGWVSPPFSPSPEFPLGTDQWGNDILSLLLYGARNTLVACAFITMVRVLMGVALGALSGWNEGKISDRIIMGIISTISSIPLLISSMILVYALDIRRGLSVFIFALSALGWTEIAQYIRSEFLVLRKMPFIEGAHAVGAKGFAIAIRHVLPNILPQILVLSFFEMGAALMLLGELSFLGVFIGGGSHIALGDEIMGEIVILSEVPEWGAMLAEGYRWLRAKPFIIATPAVAFFVSVVGLNAFGEGLRRVIETYHVNTNFLLRKRMILVIVILSFTTVFIINNTGPAPWFDKVARAFDGQSAYAFTEGLVAINGRSPYQSGSEDAATYIEEKFKEYELLPGWQHSSYIFPLRTELVHPFTQPELILLDKEGSPVQSFQHQLDFGYIIDGHGGSGEVQLPLTFVGFRPESGTTSWESFQGLDLRDQILLLIEGNAPSDFATEALIRGAKGVLWVAEENQQDFRSQTQLADFDKFYLSKPNIPVFRIRSSTAESILNQADQTLADLFSSTDAIEQSGVGWFAKPLDISMRMSLFLSDPEIVEVPCVLGYIQGSDLEIANQMVVLITNYDGLGTDPNGTSFSAANHNASGIGIMLETARLWQEQNLDSRRSVLFVAWGGGNLDESGIIEYLQNIDSFRHLPAQSGPRRLSPETIIQLGGAGAGGENLFVHPDSSSRLTVYIKEMAAEIGIPIESHSSTISHIPFDTHISGTDWVYFNWAESTIPLNEDNIETIKPEKLDNIGEILSHLLIQIVRQNYY